MTEDKDKVQFSNVCIVRDVDGKMNAYVGTEKIIGAFNITMQPMQDGSAIWTFGIPSSRVRVAERVPALPTYEADNVVPFTKAVTTGTPEVA